MVKSTKNREKYEELQQIILITSNCFIWGSIPSLAIDTNSSLKLQKGNFKILLSKNEMEPVKLAAKTLCKDFEKVMHYKPEIFQNTDDTQQIDIVIINEAVDNPLFQSRFIRPLDGFESHRVYCSRKKSAFIFMERICVELFMPFILLASYF